MGEFLGLCMDLWSAQGNRIPATTRESCGREPGTRKTIESRGVRTSGVGGTTLGHEIEKSLPHDDLMERAVLGAVLAVHEQLYELLAIIRPGRLFR